MSSETMKLENVDAVLLVKKQAVHAITKRLLELADYLHARHKVRRVYVERSVYVDEIDEPRRAYVSPFDVLVSKSIGFVCCLGGDGTLLHVNRLFGDARVPPTMCFNLGTLGFLTPFQFADYRRHVDAAFASRFYVVQRKRLRCRVRRHGVDAIESIGCVMNEVVVDRGNHSLMCQLKLVCNEKPVTELHADGLIVATSTGSTAYSLSAGGTMVHPLVPAILLTPLCPHSLSCRPLSLPDSVDLCVALAPNSRCTSLSVSLDGRRRTELGKHDKLLVSMSPHSIPCITPIDQISSWFKSISENLSWNQRSRL
jgi:NAD+ kinase